MAAGGMGRMLGLGYLFGAKDNGAVRTARGITESIDDLSGSVEGAAAQSNSLSRLGNALTGIATIQLGNISNALEGLADRAGINATSNSLESFGAQFGQTFRNATAGMGEFGDSVRAVRGQVSSTAFSLQVDAGDMLHAVTAVARTGHELDDYGISIRALGGSIQAGILNGEQLGNVLTSLSEGYDMGAEGAGRLVDTVTALGERFGVGADAVRQLPNVLQAADPILARFSNLRIDQVTESITRLALASQRRLGGTFEDNMQGAIQTFTTLGEQRNSFAQLFTGINSEFPALAQSIGIAGRDINQSMDMVMQDPIQFATNMRNMMGTLNDFDRTRLLQSMEGLPDQFLFLIQGGEGSAEALAAASGEVDNAAGAFNRMARAAGGSSRTWAESMELLKEGFDNQLNAMARNRGGMNNDRRVMQEQRAAYERLGDTLRGFSARGGVLGTLTDSFLAVRRYGLVHGLLPIVREATDDVFPGLADRISEFAPILGQLGSGMMDAVTSAGPFILAMSQMGAFAPLKSMIGGITTAISGMSGGMMGVLGPIALVAGAAYLIYRNWDTIGPMVDGIADKLTEWGNLLVDLSGEFVSWVHSIDWVAMGDQVADGLINAIDFAWEAMMGMLSADTSGMTSGFTEVLSNVIDGAFTMLGGLATGIANRVAEVDWAAVATAIVEGIKAAVLRVATVAEDLSAGFATLVSSIDWGNIGTTVANGLVGAFRMAWDFLTGLFSGSDSEFGSTLFDKIIGTLSNIGGAILPAILDLFRGFESTIAEAIFGPEGADAVNGYFDGISAGFEEIGAMWDAHAGPVFDGIVIAWDTISQAATELWDGVLSPFFGWLYETVVAVFDDHVLPTAKRVFKAVGGFAEKMWKRYIKPALKSFWDFAKMVITNFGRGWLSMMRNVVTFSIRSFGAIQRAIVTMQSIFETSRDIFRAGWQLIGASITRFFMGPIFRARNAFATFFESIEEKVSMIKTAFLSIALAIVQGLTQAFSSLPSSIPFVANMQAGLLQSQIALGQIVATSAMENTNESRRHREAAARRQADVDAVDRQVEEARRDLADAQNSAARTRSAAVNAVDQRTAQMEAGVNSWFSNLENGITSAMERAQETAGGDSEGIRRAVEQARPIAEQLRRAAERGTISQDQAAAIASRLSSAAASGDEGALRTIGREVQQTETAAPRRTPGRAHAERTTTADAAAAARDERSNQFIIDSFGRTAAGQLAAAFGGRGSGGGGTPTPRPRRGEPDGTGREHL